MNKKAIALITFAIVLGTLAFFLKSRQTSPTQASPKLRSDSRKQSEANSSDVAVPKSDSELLPAANGSTESSTVAPKNLDQTSTAEKFPEHSRAWREKFIERLEPILQERLRNDGFS